MQILVWEMALTSDRLKELTRQRMELIKEIDKCPNDPSLHEKMSCVVAELSKERHILITNDAMPETPLPMTAEKDAPKRAITSVAVSKGKKPDKKISNSESSKKLSEFF